MDYITKDPIPCPVWGKEEGKQVPCVGLVRFDILYSHLVYSPRAGGVFQMVKTDVAFCSAEALRPNVTPREKANLSYRIYRHNWEGGLLRPRDPRKSRYAFWLETLKQEVYRGQFPLVTEDLAVQGLLEQPPAEERLLAFMRELVWQQDRAVQAPAVDRKERKEYSRYLWVAVACATEREMMEFWRLAQGEGWVQEHRNARYLSQNPEHSILTLKARMWVEEKEREQGTGQQGFVAMWFDDHMDQVYRQSIKPAIRAAGYRPHRIDDNPDHSDNLVDRILAAIRQSRFVVADFTCGSIQSSEGETVYLDRGGVYYEAGFAYGLGKPVIYTCRQDVADHLHFDIRQLNHLLWTNAEELARKLQARIERQFGRGPLPSQDT